MGQWEEEEPADRCFLDWVGLYGSLPAVTISLCEVAPDGRERVIRSWPQAPAS